MFLNLYLFVCTTVLQQFNIIKIIKSQSINCLEKGIFTLFC